MPFETAVLPSRARADVRASMSIPFEEQVLVDEQVPAHVMPYRPYQAPQAGRSAAGPAQPVTPAPSPRVSGAPFALASTRPARPAWGTAGGDDGKTVLAGRGVHAGETVRAGQSATSTAERLKTWVGLYIAQAIPALFTGIALMSWAGSQTGGAGLAGRTAGLGLTLLGVTFVGVALAAVLLRDRLPEVPRGPIRGIHRIGSAMLRPGAGRVVGLGG